MADGTTGTFGLQMASDIEARVRSVLREHSQLGVDIARLAADSDLYEAGMMSRASVAVMLGLESEFDIEFPDSLLRRDVFASITAICETVERLLKPGSL